jgi:hypothetical protein
MDARMCERTAQNSHVCHPRQVDIGDEDSFPCDQLFVAKSCDPLSDVAHRLVFSFPGLGFAGCQPARSTTSLIRERGSGDHPRNRARQPRPDDLGAQEFLDKHRMREDAQEARGQLQVQAAEPGELVEFARSRPAGGA